MFQSHMRFCPMQWSATRFCGSLSVDSRPLPSEKIAPLAAQLKIAFRRFLFLTESIVVSVSIREIAYTVSQENPRIPTNPLSGGQQPPLL